MRISIDGSPVITLSKYDSELICITDPHNMCQLNSLCSTVRDLIEELKSVYYRHTDNSEGVVQVLLHGSVLTDIITAAHPASFIDIQY